MKYSLALALLLCASTAFCGTFTNGQAARAVLGQYEFTQYNTGVNSQILGGAAGVAYDPVSGNLWVADGNGIGVAPVGNRVLAFPVSQIPSPQADLSAQATGTSLCRLCGFPASLVLGQVDFTSSTPGAAQTASSSSAGSMNSPNSVATDGTRLAVLDAQNDRVLIWNHVPLTSNAAPDLVIGQRDFTSRGPGASLSASSLRAPQGVWIQNNRLFVADTANNRVLIWNSFPTANGQAADLVLGQPNFSSNTAPNVNPNVEPTTSANKMWNPTSVTATADGHVFVADTAFNRVLIWNSFPTQMDQNADVVVGQYDMTLAVSNDIGKLCANSSTMCEKTLSFPRYALSDGTRLFVADAGNNRVLIFNSIPTTNGAGANVVLGQPDFVSDVDQPNNNVITSSITKAGSVDTTFSPTSLAWDGTNLYVADPWDGRVLVFSEGDVAVPGKQVLNNASRLLQQEGVIVMSGKIVENDTVTVTISVNNTPKTYTYTVKKSDTLASIVSGIVGAINKDSGDPYVTAQVGNLANSVLLVAKSASADLNTISYSATVSNPADLVATPAGTYLAGGTSGTLAPGTLFEIDSPTGGLNDFPAVQTASTSQALPTTMTASGQSRSNVQVYVDGFPAPILSAGPNQIVAQIPFSFILANGAADRTSLSIYVRSVHADGSVVVTTPAPAAFANANPGLYGTNATTEPRPALQPRHADGNPSTSVIISGTALTVGDKFTVTISGTPYTYTVATGDTFRTVAQKLAALMANDPKVTANLGANASITLMARAPGAAGAGITVTGAVAAAGSGTATETATVSSPTTCCANAGTGLITPQNPAVSNEVVTLLATGLGPVEDANGTVLAVPAGTPYNLAQPNGAVNFVNAQVNAAGAVVVGSSIPAGAEGIYQVQLQLPSALPTTGVVPVYIAQGAFISNTVTIPVGAATQANSNPAALIVDIDAPSANSTLQGAGQAGGWVIDSGASVTSVTATLDNNPLPAATRGSRPDVCAVYTTAPDCAGGGQPGWNLIIPASYLTPGSHTLTVTGTASNGDTNSQSVQFSSTGIYQSSIDSPSNGSTVSGSVPVWGWVTSARATIPASSVTYRVDNGAAAPTTSMPRPDVCAVVSNSYDCSHGNNNLGFSAMLDTAQLIDGPHTVAVTAVDATGHRYTFSSAFTVANATANLNIDIDVPLTTSSNLTGRVPFNGWVGGPGLIADRVVVDIDGVSYGDAALYGRPDVCAAYPAYGACPNGNTGWSLPIDTTTLADGPHTLRVVAYSSASKQTSTRTFGVANYTGNGPIHATIDSPSGTVSGFVVAGGWAVSDAGYISGVQVAVDGVAVPSTYGGSRPDICGAYPGRFNCANSGWDAVLDTTRLSDGPHVLTLTAMSNGQNYTISSGFTVSNTSSGIMVAIDNDFSSPLTKVVALGGWAGSTSSAITGITAAVDGTVIGQSAPFIARPDVCAAYAGLVGCPAGMLGYAYVLDPSSYSTGQHTVTVTATTASGGLHIVSKQFTVAPSGAPAFQFNIDSPASSAVYVGTALVSGWDVDAAGNGGTVSVSIDGHPVTNPLISYSARPDVCAAYHLSGSCANSGWSFSFDTTLLADGPHTLFITATSASGATTVSRNFSVANWTSASPIQIAIDSANARLSGVAVVGGWAYAPTAPVSQVSISIDNLIVNQPALYGGARPDVCQTGSNCPNVGWSYLLDTTLLGDGVHTLTVTATVQLSGVHLVPTEQATVATTITVNNFNY